MSQTAEAASRNGDGLSHEALRYRAAVKATMRKRVPGADGAWHYAEPTGQEVDRFLFEAALYGLEPLAGQIYATWKDGVMEAVATIDGLRLIAARTEACDGQADPEWCDAEGNWRDFWVGEEHPVAARVRVYRKDTRMPFTGTANWSDFAPTSTVGAGVMWSEGEGMPAHMLGIRAEALALRKAFPAQLSGLYTAEELGIALPDESAGGPAAADVPTAPAPSPHVPAPAPEALSPPPGPGPSVLVDRPEVQPSGAPALPKARLTLAEVLASTDYERLRGELTDALFGVMPGRLTDEQTARLTGALREADAAGITAAELERTCKIAKRDAGEKVELRARGILEWIAERHARAGAEPAQGGDPASNPDPSVAEASEAGDSAADEGVAEAERNTPDDQAPVED